MRKKKVYHQLVKHSMRPESTHCLECQKKLHRCVTISDRPIITLTQVMRVVHCGYRCPRQECPGSKRLSRSTEADAVALAGFTFGLDIILAVGQLRLREHQSVDEIQQELSEQLAPLGQTISRREILVLFEAYTALVRAGTEVQQDEAWKEQVREHTGILLSLDGMQPEKGNETISVVREMLAASILNADNVTESTKDRLKQVLAPVVALNLPVIGGISDGKPTELQAVTDSWPGVPQHLCQWHAMREAGRLIDTADHRVKTDMRIRMQHKTHEYRHNLHTRLREAKEKKEEQERAQWEVLEEYAAMVEGALNVESSPPFKYGGLALQEGLTHIQTS